MPAQTYSDEEMLPLSALTHLLYCRRRAALVYIEGIWTDNIFTATGTTMQRKVDNARPAESRSGVRTVRGLRVHSTTLGLTGLCDVVEYHTTSTGERILPVEYKRGALREEPGYAIQLCAQAICLEEMTGADIPDGALFYGEDRRRLPVNFDTALRQETRQAARELHALVQAGRTPPAEYSAARCTPCSLIRMCRPQHTDGTPSAQAWLLKALQKMEDPDETPP